MACEYEVADGVGALDRVSVVAEGGDEPGIFGCDEGVGLGVGPEDVFVVGVEVDAGLLGGFPFCWYRGIDVGLVEDLWDQLWWAV